VGITAMTEINGLEMKKTGLQPFNGNLVLREARMFLPSDPSVSRQYGGGALLSEFILRRVEMMVGRGKGVGRRRARIEAGLLNIHPSASNNFMRAINMIESEKEAFNAVHAEDGRLIIFFIKKNNSPTLHATHVS
jgi:hypothetical protein